MLVRPETEQDFAILHDLVKTAFETAPCKDGKEQDYVAAFRKGQNYVPELALVAEKDGVPVGHLMLTRIRLTGTAKPLNALLLAPVSIVLEYRNKGIGSALIRKSMELAREMNFDAVFVVGEPAYYQRFGFHKSSPYGIISVPDISEEYVMVCELHLGSLTDVGGTLDLALDT